MSFNLVIEFLVISASAELNVLLIVCCFNLVIEFLVISAEETVKSIMSYKPFQSRNRVSCDFCSCAQTLNARTSNRFQSRNRVSCDFC